MPAKFFPQDPDELHRSVSGHAQNALIRMELLVRGGQELGTSIYGACPRCASGNHGMLTLEYDPHLMWWHCSACLNTGNSLNLLFHLLHLDVDPIQVTKEWLVDGDYWEAKTDAVLKANDLVDEYNTLLAHGVEAHAENETDDTMKSSKRCPGRK